MKSIFALLFVFIISFSQVHAQENPAVDSLQKVISATNNKKTKADALVELSVEYINFNVPKAYEYAKQSIEFSKKIQYTHGIIEGMNSLAMLENNSGKFSQALIVLRDALHLAQENRDPTATARCYLNMGNVHSTLKNHQKAIENYQNAYDLYYQHKDYDQCIIALNRIANRTMDIGNELNDTSYFFKAINIYTNAFNIAKQINDIPKIINSYANMADAYNILGSKTNNKNYLFYSINYSLKGLKLSREYKLPRQEGLNFLNMGEAYERLNFPFKAIHFYEEALHKYEKAGDKNWIQNTHRLLGKIYHALKNYDKAVFHINKSIELAKEQQLIGYLRDNYQILSDIYASKNDLKKSLEYQELYAKYKDSILNENSAINIARLQAEFEFERQNQEIELLRKNTEIQKEKIKTQNTQRNFLIAAIIGIFSLLVILYYRYREKQKAEAQILKAKEAAVLAKEMQEQFLANTSHEIRTPMNGIIGMTSQLLDSNLTNEQLEYALAIKESSNNLLVIINDLLDLSKIKAGKMAFEMIPFSLNDLCKNLIFTLQYRLAEKNIHLISSIDEKIPNVLAGDPVRLNQVLLNLAGNAIKFTEKGEVKINVKLLKDDGKKVRLLFSVHDTGIGIPNNKLDKIFESFTQVNATTTRKYGGTGLGLTIAKQIIEQQGGTISVSSKVNEGSVFVFFLDFVKTNKKAKELKEQKTTETVHQSVNLSKIKILVVDDNRVNQRVASLTLKKWNVDVSVADDAKSAINLLKEHQHHLILMDIAMPEMDGLEATQYIRTQLPAPLNKTPIIAMTASALIGEEEKCISAGMNDYISKPFHPNDLFVKITRLIPKELITTSGKSIDLTLLHSRAEGDKEYLTEIFETYIAEMPNYLKELNDFIENRNWPQICKQAHKMKSPAALVGAHELKYIFERIEIDGLSEEKQPELTELFSQMNKLTSRTIDDIKKELKSIT
ncbi:MAG: response regulator [Bacteroidetes bacterium]|nr:response regulator [Bacteroidota bacterium]